MLRPLLRAALLVAICAAAFAYANHVPAVRPASAPAAEFSAERAMVHVRAIAARPHPIGSEEHRSVAEYLLAELRRLGLAPEVQEATAIGTRYAAAGRVRNVVVRVPGTSAGSPGAAVLLMAHYDGVPAAPAAGDDASGSAVLLETLRAIRSAQPLTHDVIALFTDGEETGLLGAAAFVREHRWARDVAVTLNFEARGTHGPSMMFETGPGNHDLVRALRRVGGGRATSLSTFVYRRLPNDTDLSETALLGQPALNFAFLDGVNRYHTSQDDAAHLDPRSVQDHGDAAVALVRELAGNPLPRAKTGDAVFFNVALLGLVAYPESWSAPLSLVLLIPLVVVLARLRREDPRWIAGVLLGIAGTVMSVGLAVVTGVLAANGLGALHTSVGGAPAQSGIYLAAVATLALLVASIVYAALRRWQSAQALHAGGALCLAIVALITSFVAPAVSFLFVWPALATLLALACQRFGGRVGEVAIWVAAAVAIAILLPIVHQMVGVALGLDATGAAIVATFTVLMAWLAAQVLELVEGRPWRTTAVIAGTAALLFAIGAISVRTDDDAPVGSTIAYGVDADSNVAYLGARALTPAATSALRRTLGDGAGVRPPAWFARTFAVATAAPLPGNAVQAARVTVHSDSTRGDSSWVRLRITPAPGARAISVRADSGLVWGAVIDGRRVATDRYRVPPRGRFSIEYVAPPAEGFEIAMATALAQTFDLAIISYLPGIPQVAGLALPVRPAGVIPIQRGDYTLVHQRVRVR